MKMQNPAGTPLAGHSSLSGEQPTAKKKRRRRPTQQTSHADPANAQQIEEAVRGTKAFNDCKSHHPKITPQARQAIVRHASIKTTMTTYARVESADLAAIMGSGGKFNQW